MTDHERVTRAFVDTADGQIHYRTAGHGQPLLLLHQTPRSSDEYRDVVPILAREFRVIAMDTIGYGDSYKPEKACSIEDYAKGAVDLLDGLGVRRTAVVGHHTGAVIGIELAASYSSRVERLVLSASPYVDGAERERRKSRPPIDEVEVREDGGHLTELWRRRMSFYPKGRPDLLTRFVIDALRAGDKVEEGHRSCSAYRMEEKLGRIRCPTLLVCGTEDPFSSPWMQTLAAHIEGSRAAALPGGTVAMVDQMPLEFARAIYDFLRD
ncbi:MAG: alpha/beta fold hydrolase [Candidatus Rokubacteria bacterium]|nr:alpha/beta fold hydrolase [Candidatus Rokubacteria bacterium]